MAPKRRRVEACVDLTGDQQEQAARQRPRQTPTVDLTADAAGPGSSSLHPAVQAAAGAIQPTSAGKQNRSRKADKEPVEQRVNDWGAKVTYRPRPTLDVQARLERAVAPGTAHRLFLIDSKQVAPLDAPNGPSQEFQVLGATGNVYTVKVARTPSCTCPDHVGRQQVCKHMLFVMVRVLKQATDNPVIWQRALLPSELRQVLGGSGSNGADQTVMASERVRARYQSLVHGAAPGADGAGPSAASVQRPVEGECAICFDTMVAGGREAITFCTTCGNNLHKDCFTRWASSKRSSGARVTCVYCRAEWKDPSAPGALGVPAAEAAQDAGGHGYLNLAQYSEAHGGVSSPSMAELYPDSYEWMLRGGRRSGLSPGGGGSRRYSGQGRWVMRG